MSTFLVEEMTGFQWKKREYDKAILAVGSLENHGDHLPFGTDSFVSYLLSKEVAERVKGLMVLPPIWYGMSEHYKDFSLTISLRYETLTEIIRDILLSLHREGIYKVFIFNGHDGNSAPIEVAARSVKVQHPEMKIAVQDAWWVTAGELLPPDTFEVWSGLGHAGEGETSICLALFPHLVQMEHAKGRVPDLPPNADIKWLFRELTPYGATGDPTKGTKEKGEAMRKVLVDAVVEFIEKLEAMNWKYEYKAD